MMRAVSLLFLGAAFLAWGGSEPPHPLLSFTLKETPPQLRQRFPEPPDVQKGEGYVSLRFGHDEHAVGCDGDHPYTFFYDASGNLQSITYTGVTSREKLFGGARTFTFENIAVVVRMLDNDRVLLAPLAKQTQIELGQAVLMRRSALDRLLPWLAKQLQQPSQRR